MIKTVLMVTLLALATASAEAPCLSLKQLPILHFKTGQPERGQSLSSAVDGDGLEILQEFAHFLKKVSPESHFGVLGYADSYECSGRYCDRLAERRALLVYRYLLDQGINPKRLIRLENHTMENDTSKYETSMHYVQVNLISEP